MSGMARREFLKQSAAATACGPVLMTTAGRAVATVPGSTCGISVTRPLPVFIATWKFGQPVCDEALETTRQGGDMLDAIESGIRLCEADAANSSVGIGGTPNADGVVQLDAVIMAGPGHRAGSVAGLEDIAHPISVARAVMEKTDHVLLVRRRGQAVCHPARSPARQLVDGKSSSGLGEMESWPDGFGGTCPG